MTYTVENEFRGSNGSGGSVGRAGGQRGGRGGHGEDNNGVGKLHGGLKIVYGIKKWVVE